MAVTRLLEPRATTRSKRVPMLDYGLVIAIATWRTFARSVERSHVLTDLREWPEKSCTLSGLEVAVEKPFLNDDDGLDEEDEDDDDFDYFNLDELGIDPEEYYELCHNSFFHRP